MVTYKDYFDENRPKPKFLIGDRVFGRANKIPFVGTVLNDHMVNEEEGPRVSVSLDLPLSFNNETKTLILVKQKDLALLKKI